MQGLVIRVGEQLHVLRLSQIRRLLPLALWSPVPDSPHAMRGLLDLAGRHVAVIDLQQLACGPAQPPSPPELSTRLALVQAPRAWQGQPPHALASSKTLALVLRTTGDILRLNPAHDADASPTASYGTQMLSCLCVEKLLSKHLVPA